MESKKTLVLGASTNPSRYSYLAANRLVENGIEVVLIGIKKGEVAGVSINNEKIAVANVNTVSLYLGPDRQEEYYDYILSLKPKRVIFNPGTENNTLEELLIKNNIEPLQACTLVMLAAKTY